MAYIEEYLQGCTFEEYLQGCTLKEVLNQNVLLIFITAITNSNQQVLNISFLENSLLYTDKIPHHNRKDIYSTSALKRINYNNLDHFIKLDNILQQFKKSEQKI